MDMRLNRELDPRSTGITQFSPRNVQLCLLIGATLRLQKKKKRKTLHEIYKIHARMTLRKKRKTVEWSFDRKEIGNRLAGQYPRIFLGYVGYLAVIRAIGH